MKKDASSPGGTSDAQFVRRVLIFVAIVALAAALYALSDILLLVFGAILVAVVLRTIARPIQSATAAKSSGPRCSVPGLVVMVIPFASRKDCSDGRLDGKVDVLSRRRWVIAASLRALSFETTTPTMFPAWSRSGPPLFPG